MHQNLHWAGNWATTTLDEDPIIAHPLKASLIWTNQRKILMHSQNGSSKGIFTWLWVDGLQGKLIKTQFWQRWKSSIYQRFLSLSTTQKHFTIWRPNPTGLGNGWNCRFEEKYRPYWQADDSGEDGYFQMIWSGKRYRVEFRFIKCTYLTLRRKLMLGSQTGPSKSWKTQGLSSKWNSVDLFRHRLCGPGVG